MNEIVQPLYVQIAAKLRAQIADGSYPVGASLPTEAELSETFSTSRNTVREALRRLVEHGLIRRRQGSGSVVVSAAPTAKYFQSFASLDDLFANATNTHFAVQSITPIVLDTELAERLGAVAGSDWLLVSGVRWTKLGGVPLAYVEAHIPAEFAEIVAGFWNVRLPFYALLQEASGRIITDVAQEIRALEMPRHVAAAFGLEDGSFAMQMVRRYVTREGILIVSVNWHRADQFVYRMNIFRQSVA